MEIRRNKNSTGIRAYPEVINYFDELRRKASAIEGQDINRPEILRRISNIPNLPEIILKDAEQKRRNGFKKN